MGLLDLFETWSLTETAQGRETAVPGTAREGSECHKTNLCNHETGRRERDMPTDLAHACSTHSAGDHGAWGAADSVSRLLGSHYESMTQKTEENPVVFRRPHKESFSQGSEPTDWCHIHSKRGKRQRENNSGEAVRLHTLIPTDTRWLRLVSLRTFLRRFPQVYTPQFSSLLRHEGTISPCGRGLCWKVVLHKYRYLFWWKTPWNISPT